MVKYSSNQILIIADHASNYLPKEYYKLGLTSVFLNQHIAFDIGVKELSLDLSNRLKCKVIQGKYSRLLIDLNRDLDDPTVIPEIVDRKIIPGNIGLSKSELRLRVKKIYNKSRKLINRIFLFILAMPMGIPLLLPFFLIYGSYLSLIVFAISTDSG